MSVIILLLIVYGIMGIMMLKSGMCFREVIYSIIFSFVLTVFIILLICFLGLD